MSGHKVTLLDSVSTVAAGPSTLWASLGGPVCWFVVGTLTGCTAELQVQAPDGATWVAVDSVNGTLTAAGLKVLYVPPGKVRVNLSGGTCSGVSSWLVSMVP